MSDDFESFSILFADDTSLACSSINHLNIETKINSDLGKLYKWFEDWLVDFNPAKTKDVPTNLQTNYKAFHFQPKSTCTNHLLHLLLS